ncbi:MAG TPA: hypothetical protein VF623_10375 [Segetibacter sp.]|jgi:hypothetical protein
MLIVVIAGGEDQKEFQDKEIPEGVQVQFVTSLAEAKADAHAYFFLLSDDEIDASSQALQALGAPVFIKGAGDLKMLPNNFAKISPWPGFLFAESIEVHSSDKNKVAEVFDRLQWKYIHKMLQTD